MGKLQPKMQPMADSQSAGETKSYSSSKLALAEEDAPNNQRAIPTEPTWKDRMQSGLAGAGSGASGMIPMSVPQMAQMQAAQSSFQMPQNLIGDARYEALSRLAR
jgi:hypothetical protein